jgi:hypothetical protein
MGKAVLLALVVLVTVLPARAAEEEEVGRMVALRGKVLILRNPGSMEAKLRGPLFLKDTVETKERSRAKMHFVDDSMLTLSENSRLIVMSYLYSKEEEKGRSVFNLLDGKLKALVGNSEFEVHTPTSVAAARGTYFFGWVGIERGIPVTIWAVLEGVVDVKNVKAGVEGAVSVTPGKATTVAEGMPPSSPAPIPRGLLKKLLNCRAVGEIEAGQEAAGQ